MCAFKWVCFSQYLLKVDVLTYRLRQKKRVANHVVNYRNSKRNQVHPTVINYLRLLSVYQRLLNDRRRLSKNRRKQQAVCPWLESKAWIHGRNYIPNSQPGKAMVLYPVNKQLPSVSHRKILLWTLVHRELDGKSSQQPKWSCRQFHLVSNRSMNTAFRCEFNACFISDNI